MKPEPAPYDEPRESRKLGGLAEQDVLKAESSSNGVSLAMITTPSLVGVSSLMRRGSLNTPPTPSISRGCGTPDTETSPLTRNNRSPQKPARSSSQSLKSGQQTPSAIRRKI